MASLQPNRNGLQPNSRTCNIYIYIIGMASNLIVEPIIYIYILYIYMYIIGMAFNSNLIGMFSKNGRLRLQPIAMAIT